LAAKPLTTLSNHPQEDFILCQEILRQSLHMPIQFPLQLRRTSKNTKGQVISKRGIAWLAGVWFTRYNRRHGRRGTLWEERIKSVLVEGAGDVLATMAAYIHLNGVRAGLVEDPKEYRWCGYGEALGGGKAALAGLTRVIKMTQGQSVKEKDALVDYRVWLLGQGEAHEGITETGELVRRGFTRAEVKRVVAAKGRVELADYLRLRVRYFADGAVLGTKGFVNGMFVAMRARFGSQRADGARRLKGVKEELYSLRALRIAPVT
jgi:putative transposase